jgi:hypothetical protein
VPVKLSRFAAFLKCRDIKKTCGLFMEVFSNKPDAYDSLLAVDNMRNRAAAGTQDWTRYSLVLNVPDDAFGINIGARLMGPGKLWIDGVVFEEVGDDITVTDELRLCDYPCTKKCHQKQKLERIAPVACAVSR